MINWTVRLKNKAFWLAFVPGVLLLIQACGGVLGVSLDLSGLEERLLAVVNALFALLTILGVVTDPTTKGLGDSSQAMGYTAPRGDGE